MKIAIIYYSKHHNNTKNVIDVIAQQNNMTLIDASKIHKTDLSEYDLIGFASGIYWSSFHKSVINFAEKNLPENKKVFFVYTYGVKKDGYTKSIREAVLNKSADIAGEFSCPGYDTFGPFKLIGGIAKGHPNNTDYDNAIKFYNSIL